MSIYKRGEFWWVKFTTPDGQRVQRAARTKIKSEAQEFHDKLKAEAWRVKNLGEIAIHIWDDAAVRWLVENSHKKSLDDDKMHLRYLDGFLRGVALRDISVSTLDTIRNAKIATGASNATVNRMLAVVRAILNAAVKEWQWLAVAPFVKTLVEPASRIRWLTREQADALIAELPVHLSAMVKFTLATGLRESNVTDLCWSQVDLQRRCCWVDGASTKNGRALFVPLSSDALAVVRAQLGKHPDYVFTYKGRHIETAGVRAWRNALARAGIDDFRWHDLRHTWASWHVQNGTPLNVLKELGGWSDLKMVMRYAHLSNDHLAGYAENVGGRSVASVVALNKKASG